MSDHRQRYVKDFRPKFGSAASPPQPDQIPPDTDPSMALLPNDDEPFPGIYVKLHTADPIGSWDDPVTANPIVDMKNLVTLIKRDYEKKYDEGEQDPVARRTIPLIVFPEAPRDLSDVQASLPWGRLLLEVPSIGVVNAYVLDAGQGGPKHGWLAWLPGSHLVDSCYGASGGERARGTFQTFFLLPLYGVVTNLPRMREPVPFDTWMVVAVVGFEHDPSLVRLVLPDGQELALMEKATFGNADVQGSLSPDDLRKRFLKELGYHYLSDDEMDLANRDGQQGKTIIAARFWEDQHPDMPDFRKAAAESIGTHMAGLTLEEL